MIQGNSYKGFTVADTESGQKHHLIDPEFQGDVWERWRAFCGAIPLFVLRQFQVTNICKTCLCALGQRP